MAMRPKIVSNIFVTRFALWMNLYCYNDQTLFFVVFGPGFQQLFWDMSNVNACKTMYGIVLSIFVFLNFSFSALKNL